MVNYYVNKSVVLWAQRFAPGSPSDAVFGCIQIFWLRTRSRTPLLARFGYALLARSLAFACSFWLAFARSFARFALESITSNCNNLVFIEWLTIMLTGSFDQT